MAAAHHKALSVQLSAGAAEHLDDLAIVCCYGRAVVPRNAYGRREIEGLAIVEEPPRLVAQLLLLARGLLALELPEPAAVALCRRAALDSMPAVRRGLLAVLADADELTVSEPPGGRLPPARGPPGVGGLAAIGLAAVPAWTRIPTTQSAGPVGGPSLAACGPDHGGPGGSGCSALARSVGSTPGGGEGEGKGRGGGVDGPQHSCQTPATLADPSPAGHPDGGWSARPGAAGPPGPAAPAAADCGVDLVAVP